MNAAAMGARAKRLATLIEGLAKEARAVRADRARWLSVTIEQELEVCVARLVKDIDESVQRPGG